MALQRVQMPTTNTSGPRSSTRLIIVHTAEGALTYQSLGNFFIATESGDPARQVSSQVGIDDTLGVIGEYVQSGGIAWAATNANQVATQAELCGFAEWTPQQWQQHPAMLDNTARWIAEEANRYALPIVKLDASAAQGGGHGVCGHIDLGAWGGGHWDPGPNFPWDSVIAKANQYANSTPNPLPPEVNDMDDNLFIRWCYMTLLMRPVDVSGFNLNMYWLATGGPRWDVYAHLYDSPEGKTVTAARRKAIGL